MRALLPALGLLLFAAAAEAQTKSPPDVAAYDAILAAVPPGQATVPLGDMLVPVATVQLWRDQLAGTAAPGSASQSGINKWTGGNVFYTFNANVSAAHQTATRDAMAEWATFANLTFTVRTAQANYIMINDGGSGLSGGNSAVGMIGGVQQLNIGSTSWNRGTLVHEIGHALGLIHEHQRSDRNTYVTIQPANISGGANNGNFVLIPSTNIGAYDFLSVMHYRRNTLSTSTANPPADTIVPTAPYLQFIDIMGRSPDRVLSRPDRDGMALMYPPAPALTTVVTNTKDSGPGSLRAAIYKALDVATDAPGATPVISFQIPNTDPNFSGGVFTIRPTDRLPAPGPGTTIDATTQTTFTGETNASGPEVVLNGTLQNDPSTYGLGLRLSQTGVTVRGLVINGFSTQGILITGSGATGNTVAGCYLGTNPAGTAAAANTFAGIEINGGATGNTIGGTTVAARNVISGNTSQGVFLRGAGTTGNFVQGNFLGLNAAGTGALANGFAGIEIGENASGNTVGGTTAGAGNTLSGNTFQGVYLNGTSGNLLGGNFIGTNAAGTAAVANGASGVDIGAGSPGNIIGGTAVGARNVLSGNAFSGVAIHGAGTSGNVVLGNYVGVNAAGTAALGNGFGGVQIFGSATNNTVGGTAAGAGNVLSGNPSSGVSVSDAGSVGNVIAGNFIGTNPAGTAAIPNAFAGVTLFGGASGNTIGGTAPGAGNLISGNTGQGVTMTNSGTNANLVQGNLIGLNAAGTAALPNGFAGVDLSDDTQNNVIGGPTVAARNVISGNQYQGVVLSAAGTSGNRITGNFIGTNAAGNAAVRNGYPGVEIYSGATGNIIGGTAPGAGNVISGNTFRQVTLADAATTGNVIAGNLIGLNAAGLAALPSPVNPGAGIQIFGGAHANTIGGTSGGRNFISGNPAAGLTLSGLGTNANVIVGNSFGLTPTGTVVGNTTAGIELFADNTGGPQGNFIGGSAPGAANLISGNTAAGVAIYNAGTTGNRISGNSIAGNGGLGIDIWGDGVTANDAGDGDTGPANLQNFPVLTSAVLGSTTTVNGTLNSVAGATFRVEFFANPGTAREGLNFVGAVSVTTDGSGNATIAVPLAAIVPAGQRISAVAIDSAGNTSEFSASVLVSTTDLDNDGLPDAYENATWLSTGVTTGSADSDGDGMTNAQEFRAGTNPRSGASLLRLGVPTTLGGDRTLSLPSLAGHTYRIDFTDSLLNPIPWRPLADQIQGTGSPLTITDPGAASLVQRFYRAMVVP